MTDHRATPLSGLADVCRGDQDTMVPGGAEALKVLL
jgi:hypothetical protein